MAKISPLNPLSYILKRQYTGSGEVKTKLFQERFDRARNLYRTDLYAHYGCVNAIEFSNEGELLVSGGDDRRVLLWSVADAVYGKCTPYVMQTTHNSNIFCLGFDSLNLKIFSGGNDDQVLVHDTQTGRLVLNLHHRKPVYGLSVNPHSDSVLATAGEDGRVLIFDLRDTANIGMLCLVRQVSNFHSVKFHPVNPMWLVTSHSEEGIALWDQRKPGQRLVHYGSTVGPVSGLSACFNANGSQVLALRRRLPPVLYDTHCETAICQFYHPNYYNACTMKTCSFVGYNDEYVMSGSDDFNLYVWKVPKNNSEWGEPHVVLYGHRSVVNQVRFNKHNSLIASSGVEKMVKLWSPLPIGTWNGSLLNEHTEASRYIYSHNEYDYLVGHDERISHDYSDQSMQEDSKMIAFFDSLIQGDIEGWHSHSDDSVASDTDSNFCLEEYSAWKSMLCGKKPQEWLKKSKANKITRLIAQKRKRLAKMAHRKSSNYIGRSSTEEKLRKRRLAQKAKTLKLIKSNEYTKKSASKCVNDSVDQSEGVHNQKIEFEKKWRKHRTRHSLKGIYESANGSLDAPSTSTGITDSSSSSYPLLVEDFDDDPAPNVCTENHNNPQNNLINILPTPLNGAHDLLVNVLDMNNGNTSTNVVTVRNEDYTPASTSANVTTRWQTNHAASSSTTSDTYVQNNNYSYEEQCSASTVRRNHIDPENYAAEVDNPITYTNGTNGNENPYEFNYRTPSPNMRRQCSDGATDSGFQSGSYSLRKRKNLYYDNGYCKNSPDKDLERPVFNQRVKSAKMNIRKRIHDSDSDL